MIATTLGKTLRSILQPSILLILLTPFLFASLFWIFILFMMWGAWTGFLVDTAVYHWMMSNIGDNLVMESIKVFMIFFVTIIVFGPLWYLTYVLIISIFLFPLLLPRIQKSNYPNLQALKGGSTIGSIKNALAATVIFILGFFLTLPLWMFTPLAPLLNIMLTAYLNKKVFMYDVLQDYASPEELKTFNSSFSHEQWSMGFVTALFMWVPLANIMAPALTALVFIHYGLSRLEKMRVKTVS